MSHLLKHRAKDDKWRLYTTISDGWLSEWLTADEMKQELAFIRGVDHKLKIIELYWTFPHDYYDKTTHRCLTNFPALEEFTSWHLEVLRGDDYYGEIDKKYKELVGDG